MGGEELKWRQLKHKLMSSQGPHFSPRSTAKTNDKSTNRIYWYSVLGENPSEEVDDDDDNYYYNRKNIY